MSRIEELKQEFTRIATERVMVIGELNELLQGKKALIIGACAHHGKKIIINHIQTDGCSIFCFGLGEWKPININNLEILE